MADGQRGALRALCCCCMRHWHPRAPSGIGTARHPLTSTGRSTGTCSASTRTSRRTATGRAAGSPSRGWRCGCVVGGETGGTEHCRRALQARYGGSIAALDAAWGVSAPSWAALRDHLHDPGLNATAFGADDADFVGTVAGQYAQVGLTSDGSGGDNRRPVRAGGAAGGVR